MRDINKGAFPTMITPYHDDNTVDYEAVRNITKWYADNGCTGIFAVCQSSEMIYLSLDEKVKIAETVVDEVKKSGKNISVVASGHTSDSMDEQIRELTAMAQTGVDAIVWVSNRLDLHNDGDDVWIKNAETLLKALPDDIAIGIYECPYPYKRLLTPRILDWCKSTGRFTFIKDTCCDPDMLLDRLNQLKDSNVKLYNANSQTLLYTLKNGAAGFSGIMCNFHPDLYSWLCENYDKDEEKARMVQNFLCLSSFTECLAYPATAKYHMNKVGVKMSLWSRSRDRKQFTKYQQMIIDDMMSAEEDVRKLIKG
ncbi:MAG: dihydrodipicolinate synthase family protein [Clostridia bacterium]|nr:dihydrodipicolinate synthase family protein [Clostridia bacterium]